MSDTTEDAVEDGLSDLVVRVGLGIDPGGVVAEGGAASAAGAFALHFFEDSG